MNYVIISILFFSLTAQNIFQSKEYRRELDKKQTTSKQNNDLKDGQAELLEFYKQYNSYTDPGEYKFMYENLPDSISEICELIKAQLIHPIADLPKYRDVIPPERYCEDKKYLTTFSILGALNKYNDEGLVLNRKPEDRLVLSCRYHAILFASMIKYKGIPARVRYGFANYLYPGNHIYHVICEVWNDQEKRWMLVDPDRQKVDFPREQFEFGNEVWQNYQQDKINPLTYGIPNWWGAHPILDVLCHDLASVMGNEHIYFDRPPIAADSTMNVAELPQDQVALLNKISVLMENVDDNFDQLKSVYAVNKLLQFAKN